MGRSAFASYVRRFIRAILILVAVLSCANNRNTSSQKDSKPEGTVQVQGTTKDEGPVEYTQDGDSVSIGGTNLTGSATATYAITATVIRSTGTTQVYSGVSEGPDFSFSVVASGYVRIDVTRGNQTLSAVIPPNFNNNRTTTDFVTVDRTTTIAAKLMTIIGEKSVAGNHDAMIAMAHWGISVADLYILASSARRAVDNNATVSASAPPVNLSELASNFIIGCNKKVDSLAGEMTSVQYAVKIAQSAQQMTFGPDGLIYPPRVLAYRTAAELGSSSAAQIDVAYAAISALLNVFVIAAFQTEAPSYRKADSNSTASGAEASVISAYTTVFTDCQQNPATCVDPTAPVAAPTPVSSTTGSTTGGSTTGGSTTGGSTTGSSTTGSTCLGVGSATTGCGV